MTEVKTEILYLRSQYMEYKKFMTVALKCQLFGSLPNSRLHIQSLSSDTEWGSWNHTKWLVC